MAVQHTVPMPGTLLEAKAGIPRVIPQPPEYFFFARTFPNRMICQQLSKQLPELLNPTRFRRPTMNDVKEMIEGVTTRKSKLRKVDNIPFRESLSYKGITPTAKVATRLMMSRYWENFSIFALDLTGAVMRQGVFIEKMVRFDWLHSPDAEWTITRLILKYERFQQIMKNCPGRMVVPTLDVDLAWHTHQLSPLSYYKFTVQNTWRFIDHDDKVSESKLSDAFNWTSAVYQKMYHEVYSECTCWYCESECLICTY